MSEGFVYVVKRDYGFAPNPFDGVCTLATCKPPIRHAANIGDFVFGITPKKSGNKLIYAMRVSEKMTFNDYWNDIRFQNKKPIMNGSKRMQYGDNIYFYDSNEWHQSDSHHSHEDGSTNMNNLKRDTSRNAVLIGGEFFYFGRDAIEVPDYLLRILIQNSKNTGRIEIGHKRLNEEDSQIAWEWLTTQYYCGIIGFPLMFKRNFERYGGQ